MSSIRDSAVVAALALALLAALPGQATAAARRQVSCADLTVTFTSVAQVPPGVSVRALQEGRNYSPQCRFVS